MYQVIFAFLVLQDVFQPSYDIIPMPKGHEKDVITKIDGFIILAQQLLAQPKDSRSLLALV